MDFDELLAQLQDLLQREKRLSYRGLKRRFGIDDDYLADLTEELIGAKRIAVDEGGRFLVWVGDRTVETRRPSRQASSTDAERRQLTVMFCDLVGSTSLSERLDPEDLREIVRAYQSACAESIGRYQGYITQHLGDGLLVYFGYPVAHEDDAQRAVWAALEIVATVGEQCAAFLPGGSPPLQVRIGIHTGLVVVGEIGSSDKREVLALGETPNLSARLQGLAEPDTIAISAATQRLLAGMFEFRELGPQLLKGLSVAVDAFQVVRAHDAQRRFDATAFRGNTPLIGRDREIGTLMHLWSRTHGGEGHVVFVSGEAGIGKSRLLQELKSRVAGERATRIEFRCSPYHEASAFYPVIEHLQRILRFERDDSSQVKLGKLRETLAAYRFPRAETAALLAGLLSLPPDDEGITLSTRPRKRKQDTMDALVDWILEDAGRQPVCCIWEDLHWADASTLELLQLLLDRTPSSKLLLVFSFRPDFVPPWKLQATVTSIALGRLDRSDVAQMISSVTDGRALPTEMVQQILSKTDGVPLFVEELTKMLVESDLCREVDGHYELTRPMPLVAIPTTIQDSLTARLDRLAPVREIAQLGAVLGREFSYDLMRAIAPFDDRTLNAGLQQLADAELVHQRGVPPRSSYSFKHALVRDTAYESLLKIKRRAMHLRAAQALEEHFRDIAAAQPEVVAHHFTEAGTAESAIKYWQQAGLRATERSAYVEAMSHLKQGLAVLDTLPDAPDRSSIELALNSALGPVLIAAKGWGAAETRATYARTRDLSAQLGRSTLLFRALSGIASANVLEGKLLEARGSAEELLSLAQQEGDPELELEAHNTLGITLLYLGMPEHARDHLDQAATRYDSRSIPAQPRTLATAQDPGVAGRAHLALTLWVLGYAEQALQYSLAALSLASALSHPFSLAYALCLNAMLRSFRGEPDAAEEMAAGVLALSREQGFSQWWVGNGTSVSGWALVETGGIAEGIARLRNGIAALRSAGTELVAPYYLALLTDAYARANDPAEGLVVVAEAFQLIEKTSERLWEAELLRRKGELLLQLNGRARQDEAEACFERALELARQQRAKAWELRSTTSLCRSWLARGKPREARNLTAQTYDSFGEGFGTRDLRDAKALLDLCNESLTSS